MVITAFVFEVDDCGDRNTLKPIFEQRFYAGAEIIHSKLIL